MELRPYQQQARESILKEWDKGILKTLLVLPTGCGKTIVFAKVSEDCVRRGDRVLILAHRGELLEQAADKIATATGLKCATEKAEETCRGSWYRIVVGSVQTLMREKRLGQFPADYFQTIIIDEAHHCISESYQRVLKHFPDAKVLGVTATPDRGDMRNLGEVFESLAYEYTLPKAIRSGYLCPIKALTIPLKMDLTGVGIQAGDFKSGDLATALDPYLYQIADEMAKYCMDRKTVVFLPLVIMAFGLIASLVGIFTVRLKDENSDVIKSLNMGYYVTLVLVIITMIFSCYYLLKDECSLWYYFAIAGIVGIALGLAVVYITQYYTGDHKPVKTIAEQSESGPATNVIMGLSVGLESTVLPVICIGIAIIATFLLGYFAADGIEIFGFTAEPMIFGLYGTAIATVSMLASSAFILAEDTFGPITDNAGGIAEMSNQPEEVRNRTDKLDAVGNTTKALTKGYAMSSAALAAFLLFAAFFEIVAEASGSSIIVEMQKVVLGNPIMFVGGLIGAALVFFFASLAIRAVGTAAGEMVQEVRNQFADGKIMAGEKEPEYGKCVTIATQSALRTMVAPALLPILTPIVFGLLCKYLIPEDVYAGAPYAVGALIMVATIVGILMANFLNNGGGAWDNAKKYIEEGHHGGKKSPAHAAAVVGDTIGDPFKDTAGPSIHVLVKLLSTICLVTAVLYI